MDIKKMIAQMQEERALIDQAILTLERIARGGGKRRGRPPKWLASAAPKGRGRPPGTKLSRAARKAHSERMKAYWAARRSAKKK
jgi:hypothetical protein